MVQYGGGVVTGHDDDDILDLLAAVQACRDDRDGDLAFLLAHGDRLGMLITAVKLLAEAADEGGASPGHLRHWGQHAARR